MITLDQQTRITLSTATPTLIRSTVYAVRGHITPSIDELLLEERAREYLRADGVYPITDDAVAALLQSVLVAIVNKRN